MTAEVEDAYHLHLPCTRDRGVPFEIDFSGVVFYFTVRTLVSFYGLCVPILTKFGALELSLFGKSPMSPVLPQGQSVGRFSNRMIDNLRRITDLEGHAGALQQCDPAWAL